MPVVEHEMITRGREPTRPAGFLQPASALPAVYDFDADPPPIVFRAESPTGLREQILDCRSHGRRQR